MVWTHSYCDEELLQVIVHFGVESHLCGATLFCTNFKFFGSSVRIYFMNIAIGTLRAPKVDGIKEGIATCPYFSNILNEVSYLTENVSSGISHMPTTIDEVMQGAQNRANNLLLGGIVADYYIGIEGGVSYFGEKSYIFGCVYVRNNNGEGHFGFSPMVEVPAVCERMIYNEKKELGPIMEALSGVTDIRSANGSMGAWTNDMFTRKDEFVLAFKAAIAPFYNDYYRMK
jgi:non-canonical (house-cleaning) NTP pyrophosphatase